VHRDQPNLAGFLGLGCGVVSVGVVPIESMNLKAACIEGCPMLSPFPGMDPYLEQHWRDVHHRLVTYSCDQIQAQLPPELRARMEERVFVTGVDGPIGHRVPDVHVVEYPERGMVRSGTVLAVDEQVDVAAPFVVEFSDLRVTETYVEVVDASSGNRIVSTLEFLSPTDKFAGEGRSEFLRKRTECREARIPLVEIDLTRAGPRSGVLPMDSIPPEHHATYLACVERYHPSHRLEYYLTLLHSKLPAIRIPLRPQDQDVLLRLQPLVEQAYQNGRYADLNYRNPPNPPLSAADSDWADQRLRALGKR
jgi:hypothetical protein